MKSDDIGRQIAWAFAIAAAAVSLSAERAAAQVLPPTTTITTATPKPARVRLIEWNLPAQADATPGAVVVDTRGHDKDRMWFVTRNNPNLYRVEFPHSLMKGTARWTSWKLNAIMTGGLRRVRASWDRRYIFIRTVSAEFGEAVERVDTDPTKCSGTNCQTTVYQDLTPSSFDVSDVAIDDRNNVFTTHTPNFDLTQSYVQRLTPGSNSATVTRWKIPGSGVGLCGDMTGGDISINSPCISGVAVHPTDQNLIYFSEPNTNSIAELNIASNPAKLRRWSLATLTQQCMLAAVPCGAINGPRQIQIDRRGRVWVVTGSGDLVSLDPCNDRMTVHELPDKVLVEGPDAFSLAPDDDVVGYTASRTNKVGMLLPKPNTFCVTASSAPPVTPEPICNFPAQTSASVCNSNVICPVGKTVKAQVTPKEDGTYIEAQIDMEVDRYGNPTGNPDMSLNPLGITPVRAKSQGTFFFTVGSNTAATAIDRVGFIRLPIIRHKIKFARDDDDGNDGWEGDKDWHDWHGHADNKDSDDDGVEDPYDHHDTKERNARENEASVDDDTLAGGGASKDYRMTTTAGSLAMVGVTTPSDPLAQVEMRVLDAAGLLVAKSLPTPGLAAVEVLLPAPGTYTYRVINYGPNPIVQSPKLLVREAWEP